MKILYVSQMVMTWILLYSQLDPLFFKLGALLCAIETDSFFIDQNQFDCSLDGNTISITTKSKVQHESVFVCWANGKH